MAKVSRLSFAGAATSIVMTANVAVAQMVRDLPQLSSGTGFQATQSYGQYPNFEEFIGVATAGSAPVAAAVLRCGLTADGKPFDGFSSFYAKLPSNKVEVSLETRVIDGTIISTASSPVGARSGRPWAAQTLAPNGKETSFYCGWNEAKDILVNCVPAPATFKAIDLQGQARALANHCKAFMALPQVLNSLSGETNPKREASWSTYINDQRQMLKTLGH